jgi:hypothetical protein
MMITFINMTVKQNNLLNLIIGCIYISFFGLHVSVIIMTIIRSVRAKEIITQHKFNELLYLTVILIKVIPIFCFQVK